MMTTIRRLPIIGPVITAICRPKRPWQYLRYGSETPVLRNLQAIGEHHYLMLFDDRGPVNRSRDQIIWHIAKLDALFQLNEFQFYTFEDRERFFTLRDEMYPYKNDLVHTPTSIL